MQSLFHTDIELKADFLATDNITDIIDTDRRHDDTTIKLEVMDGAFKKFV